MCRIKKWVNRQVIARTKIGLRYTGREGGESVKNNPTTLGSADLEPMNV